MHHEPHLAMARLASDMAALAVGFTMTQFSSDSHMVWDQDEWLDEPFGEKGVLASNGDRIQCHCCGKWYSALSVHVRMKHHMDAETYRRLFDLSATCALIGPTLRNAFQEKERSDAFSARQGRLSREEQPPEELMNRSLRRKQTCKAISERQSARLRSGKHLVSWARLTVEQAEEAKRLLAQGELSKQRIADHLGVSDRVIQRIAKGEGYRHVQEPKP